MKHILTLILSPLIFLIVFSSCSAPVLSEKGEQFLDTLSYRYECGEVYSNETKSFDLKSEEYSRAGIHVYFKKCKDSLSYATVMNSPALVSTIAKQIFETRRDLKKHGFITLEFTEISKGGKSHSFTYSPDSGGELVLRESK